jgi:predicted nucleotidyltransferase
VARRFKPQRIILFGSYAYGQPTVDSDVDLLVIMDHSRRSVDQAIEIRSEVSADFPLDLLVRTPERVRERIEVGDFFMREIVTNGKVLYETAHP